MCRMLAGTKEPIKFPLIPRCSHQPPPTQSLEADEEGEEEEEEQSFSSSEAEGEHREEGLASNDFKWAEQECCQRQHQNQRATKSVSLNKGKEINIQKICLHTPEHLS